MGNKQTHESLMFDRVIDGESGIWVGVNGTEEPNNPMSKQKLHIQGEPFKKLKFFSKTDTNLTYEFENDITLRFYKNSQGIYYNLIHPSKNINETKIMNDIVKRHFKKIGFNSNELDHIYDLVNSSPN